MDVVEVTCHGGRVMNNAWVWLECMGVVCVIGV